MASTRKPTVSTATKPSRARSTVRRVRRTPTAAKVAETAAPIATRVPEVDAAATETAVAAAPITEAPVTEVPVPEAPVEPAAEIALAEPTGVEIDTGTVGMLQSEADAARLRPAASSPEPTPNPAPQRTEVKAAAKRSKPAAAESAKVSISATAWPNITLRFWQEQLDRTLTTGQAIMVCRSPEEAVRLQLAYLQATLVSGFERVGEVTRWSQDMVREVLPLRPR